MCRFDMPITVEEVRVANSKLTIKDIVPEKSPLPLPETIYLRQNYPFDFYISIDNAAVAGEITVVGVYKLADTITLESVAKVVAEETNQLSLSL
jgi:hypothetical protein